MRTSKVTETEIVDILEDAASGAPVPRPAQRLWRHRRARVAVAPLERKVWSAARLS